MTADDQWSCRFTRDLSNPLIETAPGLHATDDRVPSPGPIPGIVLSVAGAPVAAIGFRHEPDRTLSLSSPIFFNGTLSDALRARMLGLILKTADAETAAAKSLRIRYLQSSEELLDMPWIQRVLQNSGFTIAARIVPWTSTVCFSSASASSFDLSASEPVNKRGSLVRYETLRAASIQSSTERCQILCSLLRSVLSDSSDLTQIPPVHAESLLKDWIAENAILVLAHRDCVAVSICACVVEADRISANTVDVQIRYLGVHANFRRIKMAADLLRHLPSTLQASVPLPREDFRLTAFSDLANEAANALYASCGFARGEASVIWQRGLENS